MTVIGAQARRWSLLDLPRTVSIQVVLVGAVAVYVVLLGPVLWLLGKTVDRRRKFARRVARWVLNPFVRGLCFAWGKGIAMEARRAEGRAAGPAIVVANHASSMDIVLLFLLPVGLGDGRVWAKAWPFQTPLLGQMMRLAGHLHVDDFNLLPDAERSLAAGETQLVFPESSRSRDGRVGRFRDGAFLLAMRTGRPVIPVAIRGSHACFPPGQKWIHATTIEVEVLGVLHPETFASHADLKRRAHDLIVAAVERKVTA